MLRIISSMCDTPDDTMQCTCVRHPHNCSATFTSQPVAQLAEERLVAGDAPSIAALRAAGAMLIGKNTLHEIGVGMTGLNIRMGTARNPHDPSRYTGGSSSGSAAAVACGLVAFSLGGQPAPPFSRIQSLGWLLALTSWARHNNSDACNNCYLPRPIHSAWHQRQLVL